MKKPKAESINLPYASTVASFFGDQGAQQGNSFLGRLFNGGSRATQMQSQTGAVNSARVSPFTDAAAKLNKSAGSM